MEKMSRLFQSLIVCRQNEFWPFQSPIVCRKKEYKQFQTLMVHRKNEYRPFQSLIVYRKKEYRPLQSPIVYRKKEYRSFQSLIVCRKKEYWYVFKFDCRTWYAWVLLRLDGQVIGVMYLFTSINTRPFLIMHSMVSCWLMQKSSNVVNPNSLSNSIRMNQFPWWFST